MNKLGRPRKPLAINKKHFSESEREQREREELNVPFKDVEAPSYLSAKQKKEFLSIADKLLQLGIFTELDIDVLSQYIIARGLYLKYTEQIKKVIGSDKIVRKWEAIDEIAENCNSAEDIKDLLEKILRRQRGDDITVIMNLQDKAFKQCVACARELGITLTSRLKLAAPQPPDDGDDEL